MVSLLRLPFRLKSEPRRMQTPPPGAMARNFPERPRRHPQQQGTVSADCHRRCPVPRGGRLTSCQLVGTSEVLGCQGELSAVVAAPFVPHRRRAVLAVGHRVPVDTRPPARPPWRQRRITPVPGDTVGSQRRYGFTPGWWSKCVSVGARRLNLLDGDSVRSAGRQHPWRGTGPLWPSGHMPAVGGAPCTTSGPDGVTRDETVATGQMPPVGVLPRTPRHTPLTATSPG